MSGECRKGGVCPPAQSTKLEIIYGLKVSKIADLDAFFQSYTYSEYAVVPHTVAKIAICDCPMASGDCLVALIAKLAKMGGV